jgi:hypothetical protein
MWHAVYSEGPQFDQFDDNGIEHLFKEIDQEKLLAFAVEVKEVVIAVELVAGSFKIDDKQFEFTDPANKKFKLIYFKRITQSFAESGDLTATKVTTEHHLGWQVVGTNEKKILVLNEDTMIAKFVDTED